MGRALDVTSNHEEPLLDQETHPTLYPGFIADCKDLRNRLKIGGESLEPLDAAAIWVETVSLHSVAAGATISRWPCNW